MSEIPDERTGTEERLRDGRYHYAALVADSEAAHLATGVKVRLDGLPGPRSRQSTSNSCGSSARRCSFVPNICMIAFSRPSSSWLLWR